MNDRYSIEVSDHKRAKKLGSHVTLGHWFVYLDADASRAESGRRGRLLTDDQGRTVIPVTGEAIELDGCTLTPAARSLGRLGCLVSDRDLYRAEEDVVQLYMAFPVAPEALRLVVTYNDEPFTERDVELEHGVGIETLAALLPGSYAAALESKGIPVTRRVEFTVAEYTLAPLTGRLTYHSLDRQTNVLSFELAVESYQVPFAGDLDVALVEAGREIRHQRVKAHARGCYRGELRLEGQGPFRLRLTAKKDAEKIAEVVVPGSRADERDTTVFNELGKERLFSTMPEPGAMPLRGGFLSEGDFNATPMVVEEIVADEWVLEVKKQLDALTLLCFDMASGEVFVERRGSVEAGERLHLEARGPMLTVFVGCWVGKRPFEGYCTFVRPSTLKVALSAPASASPRDELTVGLTTNREQPVPVLLAVRDQRLTASEPPNVALAASAKRTVAQATKGMGEAGFLRLGHLLPDPSPQILFAMAGPPAVVGNMVTRSASRGLLSNRMRVGSGGPYRSASSSAAEAGPEPSRSEFPESLFYEVVWVRGETSVVIPLADSLGTFAIEAFALADGDWVSASAELVVEQSVRADLELPPAIHPDDTIRGRLRADSQSGQARVTLTRDGKGVELALADGTAADHTVVTPSELFFDAVAGDYVARVVDPETGETDVVKLSLGVPGVLKSYSRELALLQQGDTLTLDDADALTLRVLPSLEESFSALLTATAGYAHLCCEQTAAKILAATFMYLTAEHEKLRREAEQIITAGVAREHKMLTTKGFKLYPQSANVSEHYSRLAVRYLWTLVALDEVRDISSNLRHAFRDGISLADRAAEAHGLSRVPEHVSTMEEAYALATSGERAGEVRTFIDASVDFRGREVRPKRPSKAVADRALLAYAGAALIALGDLERGVVLANQVTRQFNQSGTLYSTVDSVPAIALMTQIRRAGLVQGSAKLRVNGENRTVKEAAALADQVETIEVLAGFAAIQVSRLITEDWSTFQASMPVKVGFRDARDKRVNRFKAGDRADLLVQLPDGYVSGDLLHVALPACLSSIQGGGKVKRFSVDFAGNDSLRVPLVVTSDLDQRQHFAVCVRNMFEEERVANPGLLHVDPPRAWF